MDKLRSPRRQRIDRQNNEEINSRGNQEERNHGIDKITKGKNASVQRKSDRRKVGFSDEGCDQRSQQILGKRSHHRREGSANHHTNRHINHVATLNKLLESVEHGYPPGGMLESILQRYDRTTLRIGAQGQEVVGKQK